MYVTTTSHHVLFLGLVTRSQLLGCSYLLTYSLTASVTCFVTSPQYCSVTSLRPSVLVVLRYQYTVPCMAWTLESRFQTYLFYTQHSRPGCRCGSREVCGGLLTSLEGVPRVEPMPDMYGLTAVQRHGVVDTLPRSLGAGRRVRRLLADIRGVRFARRDVSVSVLLLELQGGGGGGSGRAPARR